MGDIGELRADLDAARADLLATLAAVTPEEFERRPPPSPGDDERWSMREALWHVGLVEDWLRRVISKAMAGDAIPGYHWREPPPLAATLAYLVEWLEQSRRPTLALLARLAEDRLDEEFTLPGGEVRTARRLLRRIALHDREHTAHVQALRALPPE